MSTLYKYKAVSSDGKEFHGEYSAEHEAQITEFLNGKGLIPVNISAIKEKSGFSLLGFFKSIDYEDLILFTNNLSTMYKAGISLIKALTIIKIGPDNSKFNYAIKKMRGDIQGGKSLSSAMKEHPYIFSKVFVHSIEAGEESGQLDQILDELSDMMEKELEISRQIKSGLRYPIITLSVISLAFIVLMTFVMPKFTDFYDSFNADLPLPTQLMINISDFMLGYWWLILLGLAAVIYGFKATLNNPNGKLFIDRSILKLPVFGMLIIKGNVARFSLMFKILFKSGLPIVKSLEILKYSVKNSMISKEIAKMEDMFRRGTEQNLVNEEFIFYPELARQMMSIGLESGSLEKMLHELGSHYTKEVQYTSRHLSSILEPILTLVISVFVLMMALAIFLPMWNLIKVFNG